MRVHILGLPHTETTADWCTCAFTTKIANLARMLAAQGQEVVLYGGQRSDVDHDLVHNVAVFTEADRRDWFGDETWRDRVFDRWDPTDQCWSESNTTLIGELRARINPGDMIAITIGAVQRAVADAFPQHTVFESGVGYEGQFANFRVFESYAWQHYSYGRQHIVDGRFYDTVIPNAYSPGDFTYRSQPDDYLLFLGRMIPRKGLAVVAELAKHHRVITAGQGTERAEGAEHVGVVRGAERAALIAAARALVAPTIYIEPFGGVAVEAQLSGTPVLTVGWGAFTETVDHGVSGYHCHTLGEFLDAAEDCDRLSRLDIWRHAVNTWSLDAVGPRYIAYLELLATLNGAGWYTTREKR